MIAGAGHLMQMERPREVNALLLAFLREISEDRGRAR
jgi:pimeloyl-ACP methyl ester carboxylesterase